MRSAGGLAHWDEVEPVELAAGATRRRLGAAAGSVHARVDRLTLGPGRRSPRLHEHAAEEDILYVLAGSARLWQEGCTYAIGAGDCVGHREDTGSSALRAGEDGVEVLAFGTHARLERCDRPPAGGAGAPAFGEPGERPANVVALDAVPARETANGDCAKTKRDLGRATGTTRSGLNHLVVPPGKLPYPPHCHSAEEELFVVLEGDGTLLLGDAEHPVRAGHVVARPAGTGVAHALRGGDHGMTVLAWGTREPNDICYYPRSNKVSFRGIGLIGRLEPLDYWDGEP